MHLLFVTDLIAGKTIQALCWTFVHSLWLGLLLAAVAGIIILSTRRSKAVVRYNLLTASFLLFTAGIMISFCLQLNRAYEKSERGSVAIGTTITEKDLVPIPVTAGENNTSLINNFVSFFNEYASLIVIAWFLVILFRLTRLIGGLYNLNKIKRSQLSDPGEFWANRLQLLTTKLNINTRARLYQSGIARIPMVLGYFKPVILFPVALLASLPKDEVEAILIHELAHIRRRDYLVNMFQHFMEIFFFFNPAVLWVSSLIKTERENCCDDIAVAHTGNKRNYINALLSFQEYNMDMPGYVIGLTNKKYYLLNRVKRIINNNNKTLNAMEKTFLTSGLVLAGILAIAFSHTNSQNPGKNNPVSALAVNSANEKPITTLREMRDTIPVPKLRLKEKNMNNINTIVDGKRYDLKLKDDQVTDLTVDGEKIPDGKIADYKTITDSIIKQAHENLLAELDASEKAIQLSEISLLNKKITELQTEKLIELAMDKNQQALVLNQKLQELALVSKLQPITQDLKLKELAIVKNQQALVLDQKLQELALVSKLQPITQDLKLKELALELQQLNANLDLKELAIVKNQQLEILAQKDMELANVQSFKSKLDAEKETALLLKLNKTTSKQVTEQLENSKRFLANVKEMEKTSRATSTEIINDLVSEKIIKNKKDLSFTLNSNELIVNGVTQPEAIHQKLKEKYVKGPDWNFNYNNKEQ